jgi:Spy/CpxP family protein refolding chaperone
MNFRYFLIPILATAACASLQAQGLEAAPSSNSSFEPHHKWGHHHGGWIGEKLNLTDTQKSDFRTYRQRHKAEFRAAMAGMVAAKLKLQQDIDANDPTAITADAAPLGQAAAQLAKVHAAEFNFLRGILNAEQKSTWQDLQQKRQTRMQDWLSKLNQSSS